MQPPGTQIQEAKAALDSHPRLQNSPPLVPSRVPLLPFPLTWQQHGVWTTMCKEGNLQHRRVYALRLTGELDLEAFRASIVFMWWRHDVLRTRIVMVNNTPHQVADRADYCPLTVVDEIPATSSLDGNEQARREIETFFSRPMDLMAGPLVAFTLIRVTPREHIFALKIHHLITDHLSDVLFFKEFWLAYGNLSLHRPPFDTAPPLQYADYAIWQLKTHSEWIATHRPWWQSRLAGIPAIRIPADDGLKHVPDRSTKEFQLAFGEPLSGDLLALARREQTMPALLMLTLYAALVFQWCQQNEFVLPYAVAGRQLPAHVNVLGPFAHLLFICVRLSGHETYLGLLKNLTQEFFSSWRHFDHGRLADEMPHLTCGTLLEWLSWQSSELQGTQTPDEWQGVQPCPAIEQFKVSRPENQNLHQEAEITLYFWKAPDGIRAHGYYRADLFLPQTIERFQQALLNQAHVMVRDPSGLLICSAPGGTDHD